MSKICCFAGHRDAPAEIAPALAEAVERHIVQWGVTEFLVGHYGNFDRMAAGAVRRAKADFPQVRLSLMLPYLPTPGRALPPGDFDAAIYPEGLETVPQRLAILRLNRIMAERSDYMIAYVRRPFGGAAQAVQYAWQRGLSILNLGEG